MSEELLCCLMMIIVTSKMDEKIFGVLNYFTASIIIIVYSLVHGLLLLFGTLRQNTILLKISIIFSIILNVLSAIVLIAVLVKLKFLTFIEGVIGLGCSLFNMFTVISYRRELLDQKT
uniref:CSON014313 protein n=1 Tax=Culicoides sonorensis TaxID=179676 RepID=A0A336LNR7_CULSO